MDTTKLIIEDASEEVTSLDLSRAKKIILEAIDKNTNGCFYSHIIKEASFYVSTLAISKAISALTRNNVVRMREDTMEHDWEYIRVPVKKRTLTKEEYEILKHVRKNELYCGGSQEMDMLIDKGYMEFVGVKSFAPDPYYKLTVEGGRFLDEYTDN